MATERQTEREKRDRERAICLQNFLRKSQLQAKRNFGKKEELATLLSEGDSGGLEVLT